MKSLLLSFIAITTFGLPAMANPTLPLPIDEDSPQGFTCVSHDNTVALELHIEDDQNDISDWGKIDFEAFGTISNFSTTGVTHTALNGDGYHFMGRGGDTYKFKLKDKNGQLHNVNIYGQTIIEKNPGCHPGGRMTCDFNVVTSYTGHLYSNKVNHAITCDVQ